MVFISLIPRVTKKVGKVSLTLKKGTIPGQVVPLLIWAVPLLIWWVGSNSDYKAISVQLQLQFPAGTELGNEIKRRKPRISELKVK